MGWSDITPSARYTEPALRSAIVEFVTTLDLTDVTLAGESMGATVSLTASTELGDRVRGVVAFNTYDYSKGVGRANRVASIYVGSAHLPGIGPVVTRMETKPVLGSCCGAVSSTGASCPTTTSPSCVGLAVVAAIRAWRARSSATWTA
jgi:pimeloyl-ACP methyl ester carboxylesterase